MKALLHKSLFLLLLVVSIHLPAQSPVFTDPALDPYDVSDFNLFRSQTISTSSSFTGSGTVFSADGKKMFVLFRAFSDKVSEYELSEAFNVSTSVYSGSTEDLIVTGQDTNPMDLTFNADGSKLFIVGAKTGAIIEYILGTPYDVSTATYAGDEERFLVDFLENATGGSMAFGADGMKMFVAKANIFDDIIEEYNLSVPYDVSTATNAGTAEELDVSAQIDLGIRAFTFNANGSKLFVADCCSIVEYDLATAFDVSTAMYAGDAEKIEIKDQNLFSPRGVTFDPAGTKMYITLSRVVYEYELSEKVQYQENATNTIIDINANDGDGGADDNSVTYSISGSDADLFNITKTGIITFNDLPDFENPRDADSDNRYDIYIKATAGVDTTQIPLVIHVTDMDDTPIFTNVGVGFDVSTAVYTGLSESFLVSSEDAFASDLQFNVDGSKMYVIGSSESDVDEYSLSRAYDISTATYDGESENFSVIQQTRGNELVFSTDGKKMFVSGDNPKSVFEYHLATPFDVSTSMLTMTFSVEDQVTSGSVIRALSFRSDGLQMFVARSGGSSGIINHTYDLIVGFDLSTAVYSGKADTISRAGDGISFSDEGTKMFVTTPRDVIDEYVLDTAYTISSATFLGESESFSVEDQSEDPLSTIFNPGGTKMFVLAKNRIYEYQLASVIEYLADSGEDVLDIDANDGLGGANDISVTYNLEGADASLFTIDGFGVITFNSAPAVGNPQNADMNNIYELTVVATNSSETIRQSVVVSVIDLPTITSASSVSIDENTVGFFYKAEADTAVTFSLGTNKDESLFDLNTDSLGFITPPDFENPADQNSDNRYVVDLVATDSLGNVVTEEITILVRNVDEGSETNLVPTFISENTASVDENTPVSQVVLDVQATDGDGGAEDEGITYAISGVDATAFAIDGDDGEIRFVSIPDFENPIDDGNNNAYNITVIADDGDTINNRTTQEIVITVNDVDEGAQNMAPVFSSAGSVSIAENTPTTTIVLDVDATDGDGGAVDVGVTYLLGGVDASNFNMDADNGEIRFASSPDFENPTDDGGNNVYNITVTADDGEAENNTSMQ
ncbi:MAG: cadherin domain-containing protein, partial [Cyclobacteriaceae bacterium]|nr:cadherin domain-containing protein [Cyclobacteriaceae bacterium HetDA_MAG_MS6]